jgi:WD40 repeat protein/serine/threonine protein kinase
MLSRNQFLHNRYRIIRPLGRGGFGQVYEALDDKLDCIIAIKERHAELHEEKLRRAFEREAKLLANLRHPVLPKVSDHFFEANGQYLVMEFIEGDDLATLLSKRQQPFSVEQVLFLADEVLKALEYLHGRPEVIIHRDIKPANIKLTNDKEIFLLDFGLAKGYAGAMPIPGSSNRSSSVHGYTAAFASLEQLNNSGTSEQSDLYSLGATLYNLITGRVPVTASQRYKSLEMGQHDPLLAPHEVNPAVPLSISLVLSQAMAMSRRDRIKSAKEMRLALIEARRIIEEVDTEPSTDKGATNAKKTDAQASDVPASNAPSPAAPSLTVLTQLADPIPVANQGTRGFQMTPRPINGQPLAHNQPPVQPSHPSKELSWSSHINSEPGDSSLASTLINSELHDEGTLMLDEEIARQTREREEIERRRQEDEFERQRLEAEAAKREAEETRLREEEAERQRVLAEKRVKAEGAEAARRAKEERQRQKEQQRREAAAAAARLAQEKEAARIRTEEEARQRIEEETRRKAEEEKRNAEEEARRRMEETRRQAEAEHLRLREEEDRLRQKESEEEKSERTHKAHEFESIETTQVAGFGIEETREAIHPIVAADEEVATKSPAQLTDVESPASTTVVEPEIYWTTDEHQTVPSQYDGLKWLIPVGVSALILLGILITALIYFNRPDTHTTTSTNKPDNINHQPNKITPPHEFSLNRTLDEQQGIIWSVAYAPNGKLVASAGDNRSVLVWDTQSWQLKYRLEGHQGIINSIAFSPDSSLIASGSSDRTIKLWNANDGAPIRTLSGHSDKVLFLAFSPDSQRLASASEDRSISLWNVTSGREDGILRGHNKAVWAVGFSLDGQTLVSAGKDQMIRLWNVKTRAEVQAIEAPGAIFLIFSPNGEMLASGHNDKTIRLWDWKTGQVTKTLTGHEGNVNSLSFSKDGTTLASASKDKTVKVWDVQTGRPRQTLTGHTGSVESISFSPDDKILISGSQDKSMKIWQ